MKHFDRKNMWQLLVEFLGIAAGAITAAFAIEEFLVPCTILDGGVVGIGIIVNYLTGWPLGLLTIVLNTPFLLVGSRKMGTMFIVKSVYAMAIFSLFLELFAPMQNATSEYLLAVSFGGVILGIGAGVVIRFGGCLDGTETVAILLNKKFKLFLKIRKVSFKFLVTGIVKFYQSMFERIL